ncbi:hypothetical protein ACD578_12340 [Microvirga sp. RSM25]
MAVQDLSRYRIVEVAVEGVEIIRSWSMEEEGLIQPRAADTATADRIRIEPAANFRS